jgi:transposase
MLPSGGKSDAEDAFILADLLRTDGHRFRPLQPVSDETRALRALVRTRDDLVAQRTALANQLRALLESLWPGAAQIVAHVDSPIALAFLSCVFRQIRPAIPGLFVHRFRFEIVHPFRLIPARRSERQRRRGSASPPWR